jgi:hypothetical protein
VSVPPGAVAPSGGAWASKAGLDAGLAAVKRGLRLFFWDWATVTIGGGSCAIGAAGMAALGEWVAAEGFALAAFYAWSSFRQERLSAVWKTVAMGNHEEYWRLVDLCEVVNTDGSRTPLRQALAKASPPITTGN